MNNLISFSIQNSLIIRVVIKAGLDKIEPIEHGKFQFLTEAFILVVRVFLLLDEFSEVFD